MEDKNIVHICYPQAAGWVLRLLSGLHASSSIALKERMSMHWQPRLSEVALAVSSKIQTVGVSANRVDQVVNRIGVEVTKQNDKLCGLVGTDACLLIRKDNLLFEALLDIESFLFEMHSTLEITECFVKLFRRWILNDAAGRHENLAVCFAELGFDQAWFDLLDVARNLFSHQTAPWLALEIQAIEPLRFDLLILRRNVVVPDAKDYIHFNDCRGMYRGYFDAMEKLHTWLFSKVGAIV